MASRAAPATTPTTGTRAEAVAELEQRLGHVFADRALFEQALTHASVGDGAPRRLDGRGGDNERLEFLGDRVLGLLVAERLASDHPAAREGQLTRLLHALVDQRACARVARRLGLGPALRLSGGETKTGGREKDTVLGDACEALIAALYVEGGLGLARTVFDRVWAEEFDAAGSPDTRDAKSALQEWAQARGRPLPAYAVVSREGPEHAPAFTVEVQVEGLAPQQATGGSRRVAEAAAAQALLAREARA